MAKEFYAAFIQDSYRVEGDERSRTNPGHGYPAFHIVSYTSVEEFQTEDDMRRWVERQEKSVYSKKYRIVKCIQMEVRTTVNVEVAIG